VRFGSIKKTELAAAAAAAANKGSFSMLYR
jgi:hypothetical protein